MAVDSGADDLAALPLFRGLTAAEMDRVRPLLHTVAFPAGATVMTTEQPAEVAYIIRSGTVKVSLLQASGAEVLLNILGPGETMGELGVVDRRPRSATIVTLEATECLWLDRAALEETRRAIPALTENLLRLLSRRLRLADARFQALATLNVDGRVARQLLAFAEEYGEAAPGGGTTIPLRLTQGDLAGLVGASRVRVNQALVGLRERGLLAVDARGRHVVRDAPGLARRCQ